jgi:hypothetical protein
VPEIVRAGLGASTAGGEFGDRLLFRLPRTLGARFAIAVQELGEPGQHAQQLVSLPSEPLNVPPEPLVLAAERMGGGKLGEATRLAPVGGSVPEREYHAENDDGQETGAQQRHPDREIIRQEPFDCRRACLSSGAG